MLMNSLRWFAWIACATIYVPVSAFCGDNSVPLLQTSDLRAAPSGGFQGATGDVSGAIHYPDEILAYPIADTPENEPLLDAWKGSHRFFVVPFELSIAPAPGRT